MWIIVYQRDDKHTFYLYDIQGTGDDEAIFVWTSKREKAIHFSQTSVEPLIRKLDPFFNLMKRKGKYLVERTDDPPSPELLLP